MRPEPPSSAGEVLDGRALFASLGAHLGRIHRRPGFVSIVVLRSFSHADREAEATTMAAAGLRRVMRTNDILGRLDDTTLVLVLLDADMNQARHAAKRLMGEAANSAPELGWGAAVATGFGGEVAGGAPVLLEEASRLLRGAGPGSLVMSDAAFGRPRVLVVDDDPAFAASLAATITELGWSGEVCPAPADPLEQARDQAYCGLFADVALRRRSAVDLSRAFLSENPPRPVILMSGPEASSDAVLAAQALGPVMFLGKPPSREDVASALGMLRLLFPGARR